MNTTKKYLSLILLSTLSLTSFQATAETQACGKVTIADMNWSSATLLANIDNFILSNAFDCDAELVPGDTNPTGTSMIEKSEPDIAPELWTNNIKDALDKGVAENRLRLAGQSLSDGGQEGFWVPKYMVDEKPELATIEGIIANADLFKHPEDPEKSALYSCPTGWACQITTKNLARALKLEEAGFELVDPGSGAGLAGSIAKANERKEPWFGYYWSPTPILGTYEMVQVDFGSGVDEEEFKNCTVIEDCENPKVTMFPPGPVYTVTSASFAERAPNAYEYLTKRSFTNAEMNVLLAWMEANQADGEIAMIHFIEAHESKWAQWLNEEQVAKVKEAIVNL